jgi:hypothetical protein
LSDEYGSEVDADVDELDAPAKGRRMDVTTVIPRTILAVQMQLPAQGSDPEQDPPDAARARCSGAGPGGSIFRSTSSPAAKVNGPKVS